MNLLNYNSSYNVSTNDTLNITTNSETNVPPVAAAINSLYEFATTYFIPFCCVVGLLGNSVGIIAFYKCLKHNICYLYQILLLISDLLAELGLIQFLLFYVILNLAWTENKSYYLLWYVAKVVIPFPQYAQLGNLCLLMCINGDRIYALRVPVHYATLLHKTRAVKMALLSYVVGSAISATYIGTPWVEINPQTGLYFIVRPNTMNSNASFITAMNMLIVVNQVLRATVVLIIIALIVAVAVMYTRYFESKRKEQINEPHGGTSSTTHRGSSKQDNNSIPLFHMNKVGPAGTISTEVGVGGPGQSLSNTATPSMKTKTEQSLTKLLMGQTALVISSEVISLGYIIAYRLIGVSLRNPTMVTVATVRVMFQAVAYTMNSIFYLCLCNIFRNTIIKMFTCVKVISSV